MRFFKDNWLLLSLTFLAGAWIEFIFLTDWGILFKTIDKYQIIIGSVFALVAACFAWMGILRQIETTKVQNRCNHLVEMLSAYRCIAIELINNSVICKNIEEKLQSIIDDGLLTNRKVSQFALAQSDLMTEGLFKDMFLEHLSDISKSKEDMSFTISQPYILIPPIKTQTENLRKLERHDQYIGSKEQKEQYELIIIAINSAYKKFFDTSVKAGGEIKKLEQELKQFSEFLP